MFVKRQSRGWRENAISSAEPLGWTWRPQPPPQSLCVHLVSASLPLSPRATAQADSQPSSIRSRRSLCCGCCRTDSSFSLETSKGLTLRTHPRLEGVTQTCELTPLGGWRAPAHGKCVSRRLQSAPFSKQAGRVPWLETCRLMIITDSVESPGWEPQTE